MYVAEAPQTPQSTAIIWHGVEMELRLISPWDINIDRSYQRDDRPDRLRMISEEYDPLKFEPGRVNQRPDGSLWAVNCQHRVLVAREKGEATIPVVVSRASKEVEATMFIGSNNTRALATFDKHKALLSIDEEEAVLLQREVEQHGFYLVSHGRRGDPGAIGAIETLKILGDWGVRGEVLSALARIWPTDNRRTHSEFIKALGVIYRDYKVDTEHLVARLNQVGYGDLKEQANSFARARGTDSHGGGGSRKTVWSQAIEHFYRKNRVRLPKRETTK